MPRQYLGTPSGARGDRRQFLSTGARGALALSTAGAVLALPGAAAADAETDLVFARLGASVERLLNAAWTRALNAGAFTGSDRDSILAVRRQDQAHYKALAAAIGAGAPTDDDLEFVLPDDAFGSASAAAGLGHKLSTLALGAYLGAAGVTGTPGLAVLYARIAASEAQHLSVLSTMLGGDQLGRALPTPLTVEAASDALTTYLT
jgi:hypothetical protein